MSLSENRPPLFLIVLIVGLSLGPLIYFPYLQQTFVKFLIGASTVMAALVLWLRGGFRNRPARIGFDKDAVLFLGIFILAVVSATVAVDKRIGLIGIYGHHQGLAALALLTAAFMLVKQVDWTPARYRFVLTMLVAGGAAQASVGWAQTAGGSFGFEVLGVGLKSFRAAGTFGNPNVFGSYMVPMIPLSAALAGSVSGRARLFAYPAVAFIFIAVLSSFSIAAWLSIAVMGAAAAADRLRRTGFNRSFLLTASAGIALAVGFFMFSAVSLPGAGMLKRIVPSAVASGSAGSRIGLWKAAVRLILERPLFGWGPDSFGAAAPGPGLLSGVVESPAHPHNLILEFGANLGLPAALLLLVLIGRSLWRFWGRHRRETDGKWSEDLGLWVGLAVIGQLTVTLTQSLNFSSFFLFLALLGLQAGIEIPRPERTVDLPAGAHMAMMAGAVGLCVLAFWAGGRAFAAETQYRRGLRAGEASAEAVSLGRQAIELNPYFPVYRYRLARVYLARVEPGRAGADYQSALRVLRSRHVSPGDPTFPKIEARLHEKRGGARGIESAIRAARRALDAHPRSAAARRILGDLYFAQKDYAAAAKHYAHAANSMPDSPYLWLRLGRARNKALDRQGALEAYDQALSMVKNKAEVEAKIGVIIAEQYLESGTPEGLRKAVVQAGAVLADNPRALRAHVIAADAAFALSDYREAADHYRTASRLRSGSFYIMYQLAKSLYRAGNLPEALEAYREATAIKPDASDALREIERIESELDGGEHY